MIDALIRQVLRLPHFKGKSRLEEWLRRHRWVPRLTRVKHDLLMELDPRESLQFHLLKTNWLEPATLGLYEAIFRLGDVFVDVGAHVGFHSLVARHLVGSEGLVVAFEPQPFNASKVLANCRANHFTNIHLVVGAAGSEDGALVMCDQAPADRALLSIGGHGRNEGQRFEVQVRRLDGVLRSLGVERVRLLKVDVEGYELDVLQGLGDRLESVENLILEFQEWPERRGDNEGLLAFLGLHGFELLTVRGERWKRGEMLPERNIWARRHG